MTANTNPIFPATIRTAGVVIGEESLPDSFDFLIAAGGSGTRIDKIVATNTSASAISIDIGISPTESNGDVMFIFRRSVPAGAGLTTDVYNIMPADLCDEDGKFYLSPAVGTGMGALNASSIMIKPVAPVASGDFVTVMVLAGDY